MSEAILPFACNLVREIANPLIWLLGSAAFVVFLWGVARFIATMSAGGETKEGKGAMFWGLVGLVIIFGAYGILNIALVTFGLDPYAGPGCGNN